jgi:hypothetical protein
MSIGYQWFMELAQKGAGLAAVWQKYWLEPGG